MGISMKKGSRTSKWLVWAACLATMTAFFASDTAVVGASTASAQANVTVTPTRLVFEDRDRSEELVLLNRGNEAVTYRVALIGMHMTDEGSLERVEEPVGDQLFAHDLLRFAPRQVHIEPGQSQRIRVMVRKPPDLEEGEYRSHMLFQAVPDSSGDSDEEVEDDDQLALRLNIISGISIATIVRHGELSVDMEIEDLGLIEGDEETPGDELRFVLNRDGDRSVYGDIKAEYVPEGAEDAEETIVIGQRNGTAVYTPNEKRSIAVPITMPDGASTQGGRIVVTYSDRDSGEPLASEYFELP